VVNGGERELMGKISDMN